MKDIRVAIIAMLLASAAVQAQTPRLATFDVDASPPVGSPLAYDPTKEVESPLSCRGFVLIGKDQPIVWCAVDWIGIGNDAHQVFREMLAKAAGTTVERVAVHTLHQHDAPWCDFAMDELLSGHGLAGKQFDSALARAVMKRAADAVTQAMKDAQPVTHIGIGRGPVEQVASNRRILGPDGRVKYGRMTATKKPEVRAFPEGVIDAELKLIAFYNEAKPLAALTFFATHPQSYYRTGKANPDFVGMARNQRQSTTSVPHIHFNGAGGNIGAGKYNDGNPANRPILAGRLETGMTKAWDAMQKSPINTDSIGWRHVAVQLPAATHLNEAQLRATVADTKLTMSKRTLAAGGLVFLQRARAGAKTDLACLQLGPARMLSMPGELLVEYQLAAQQMRPDLFVTMAAYGDYGPSYIGTAIAYEQGGYETEKSSSFVAPAVENVLLGGMRELLEVKGLGPTRLGVEAAKVEVERAKGGR